MSAQLQWWFQDANGQTQGPIDLETARAWRQQGYILPDTLVYDVTGSDWLPAGTTAIFMEPHEAEPTLAAPPAMISTPTRDNTAQAPARQSTPAKVSARPARASSHTQAAGEPSTLSLLRPVFLLILLGVGFYVWINRAAYFPLKEWACEICDGGKTALELCLDCMGTGKVSQQNQSDLAQRNEYLDRHRDHYGSDGSMLVWDRTSVNANAPRVRHEQVVCSRCQGKGGKAIACPICTGVGLLRRPAENPKQIVDRLVQAIEAKDPAAAHPCIDYPSLIQARYGGFNRNMATKLKERVEAMIQSGALAPPTRLNATVETGLTYVNTSGTIAQGGARTIVLGVRNGSWRVIADPLLEPAFEGLAP